MKGLHRTTTVKLKTTTSEGRCYCRMAECSIKKEEDVRSVTLRGFSMGRVSGRRTRSYNVAGGSPYLPDEGHAMYRRANSCRQAATSRNVDFGLLFQQNAVYVIIGANGGVIRA